MRRVHVGRCVYAVRIRLTSLNISVNYNIKITGSVKCFKTTVAYNTCKIIVIYLTCSLSRVSSKELTY